MVDQTKQKHLLIIEDDKGYREFSLENSIYSVGRHQKCDIRLFSQFVSRVHATLVRRLRGDGSYYYQIVDGDLTGKTSANGLLINGRKLKAYKLTNNDEIIFAPQVRAVYYVVMQDSNQTELIDELDITLTSDNMIDDPEELNPLDSKN